MTAIYSTKPVRTQPQTHHYRRTLQMTLQRTALTALALALIPAASHAAVIQVDLNDRDPAPAGWNSIDGGLSLVSVTDSDGNDDGVTVSNTLSTSSGTGNEGAYDGGFWDEVADDYLFTTSNSATVTIENLLTWESYTLKLISSTDSGGSSGRISTFTVNGSAGDGAPPLNGFEFNARNDGFNNALEMTFSGVTPDMNGEIIITVTKVGETDAAIFNGFTIEGNFTIPEPSTAILAGLGLMGVCFRRRRRG